MRARAEAVGLTPPSPGERSSALDPQTAKWPICPEKLFALAGFSTRGRREEVRRGSRRIRLDSRLTPEQKDSLIAVFRSHVAGGR
jgi:hypothetical protein